MRRAFTGIGVIIPVMLLACGEPSQRLDEYGFYDGPQFRLKVVRYYRNIPFNYLGEQAVVMCQSGNTAGYSSSDPQDAGWRLLGAAPVQGSKSAREVALKMKDDYEVVDDNILVAKTSALNISLDACGHFISWDPDRLPETLINPAEKPDSCAPNGPTDCRHYNFEGDRAPRYENVRVSGNGRIDFDTTSKAFRGVVSLHVETRNNGAVWHVDTVGLDADGQRLVPDTLRFLSVALLEEGMHDVSLAEWLESALPPGSMVIWPDMPAMCGVRPGTDGAAYSAQCAEIRFSDVDGNSGVLYIAMNVDQENRPTEVSFHSAVYASGNRSRPAGSLTALRASLAAGTK